MVTGVVVQLCETLNKTRLHLVELNLAVLVMKGRKLMGVKWLY